MVHNYLRQSSERTFRRYPQGSDRGGQTQRATLMRALGMSLRSASDMLAAFGESLSRAARGPPFPNVLRATLESIAQ